MEIRIKKIQNAGDIRSEFIELKVNAPTNLKNFILSDSFYTHSDKDCRKHLFWFPELPVTQGITIRLNTRKGINNLQLANFYWNLDEALWKEKFISAYLIRIDDYIPFPDTKGFLDNLFSSD
jgi:hypothetical protein